MNLQEIEKLAETGKDLKYFLSDTLLKVRSGQNMIDKHNDGFGTGSDKIQSMNINMHYSSFSGVFGDSSTYSDISGINKDVMKKYFLLVLNKHKDEIIDEMANMMINDARKEKENALRELEERKQRLINLLND